MSVPLWDCVIKESDDILQYNTTQPEPAQPAFGYANVCVQRDRVEGRRWEKLIFLLWICMNNNIIEVDITLCCQQTHSSSNLSQLRVNT